MSPEDTDPPGAGLIRRLLKFRRGEGWSLLLSVAFGFCLMCSYYVLKPIRDEIGAEHRDVLSQLWTAVFFVMLAAAPLLTLIAGRFNRRRLVQVVYRFFILNLVVFFVLLRVLPDEQAAWVERAFYVWTSVYVMFVVSLFWAFCADLYRPEQARRMFGVVAVGSTLGAMVGAALTAGLVTYLGAAALVLVSAIILELACWCAALADRSFVRRGGDLSARPAGSSGGAEALRDPPIAGSFLRGLAALVTSPYILGIAAYVLFMTMASTFLYYEQSDILRAAIPDRAERTALLARIELGVSGLVLLAQCFLTGRMMSRLGVGLTLIVLPLVSIGVFITLAMHPVMATLIGCVIAYRGTRYAFAKPSREVLFTVVSREQRFKTKPIIDTVVYRGGDVGNAWLFELLAGRAGAGFGWGHATIAFCALPLLGAWALLAVNLGREQSRMARRDDADRAASE
jgi:AAA family ATP:ADP antiporter